TNRFLNIPIIKQPNTFEKGIAMRERPIEPSWRALLAPQLALPLSVLLGGVLLHSMNVLMPSRPGEFHPEPLTDPDLTLSRHPARATERRLPPPVENWSSSCCKLARSQR